MLNNNTGLSVNAPGYEAGILPKLVRYKFLGHVLDLGKKLLQFSVL